MENAIFNTGVMNGVAFRVVNSKNAEIPVRQAGIKDVVADSAAMQSNQNTHRVKAVRPIHHQMLVDEGNIMTTAIGVQVVLDSRRVAGGDGENLYFISLACP